LKHGVFEPIHKVVIGLGLSGAAICASVNRMPSCACAALTYIGEVPGKL
jgi:hypothetical protein